MTCQLAGLSPLFLVWQGRGGSPGRTAACQGHMASSRLPVFLFVSWPSLPGNCQDTVAKNLPSERSSNLKSPVPIFVFSFESFCVQRGEKCTSEHAESRTWGSLWITWIKWENPKNPLASQGMMFRVEFYLKLWEV